MVVLVGVTQGSIYALLALGFVTIYNVTGAYPVYRCLSRAALRAAMDRVFELFPVLRERASQLAGSLSGGSSRCSPSGAS
jgi:hypothetical protein